MKLSWNLTGQAKEKILPSPWARQTATYPVHTTPFAPGDPSGVSENTLTLLGPKALEQSMKTYD